MRRRAGCHNENANGRHAHVRQDGRNAAAEETAKVCAQILATCINISNVAVRTLTPMWSQRAIGPLMQKRMYVNKKNHEATALVCDTNNTTNQHEPTTHRQHKAPSDYLRLRPLMKKKHVHKQQGNQHEAIALACDTNGTKDSTRTND